MRDRKNERQRRKERDEEERIRDIKNEAQTE